MFLFFISIIICNPCIPEEKMKLSDFPLKKLDDFATAKELETKDNPFVRSPFGLSTEGNFISGWTMTYRRLGIITSSFGRNLFSKDNMILITVPPTETGIAPLATDMPFGWDGKINGNTAELAVWWAFELVSGSEAEEFMRKNHPVVVFSYFDSDGMGEMSVKFNGNFWEITG